MNNFIIIKIKMITINTKELSSLVSLCVWFISKWSTLEILKNIYIWFKDENLMLRSTDMEKYIEITKKLNSPIQELSITIDAKKFLDCVRNISENDLTIGINIDNNTLYIQTQKDDFELKWIPSSEYVSLPTISSDNIFNLHTKLIHTGLTKTEFICNEKSFSPIFTWVCLYTKPENIIFVSSDGQALFEYKTKIENPISYQPNVIIPKTYCSSLISICSYINDIDQENKSNIKVTNNMISFSFNLDWIEINTSSVLIQWTFPDYSNPRVMPTEFNTTTKVDSISLDKQIKKIWIMADDIKNICKIKISDNKLHINSVNSKSGRWWTYMNVSQSWEDVEFVISGKYINDYIRSSGAKVLDIKSVNNVMSFILSNEEDAWYISIIRPMKI